MRTKARIIASRPRKLNSRHGPDFSTLLPCVVACDGAPHCRCSREQIISSVAFSSRANGSAVVPSESGLLFTVPEGAAFVGDDGNDHYSPNGHPFIMRLHQLTSTIWSSGGAGLPRQVTERRLRTERRSPANRRCLQILLAAVLAVAAAAPNRFRNQSEPSFGMRRVSIPRVSVLS
jgi:hypothetical protein